MERRPEKKRFNDYEQFALNVFDDVDLIMKMRGINSIYEHIDERYSRFDLYGDDLERAASALMTHAIEPPQAVEIIIKGQNPYTTFAENDPRGHVWISMQHIADNSELITRTYTFLVDNRGGKPIDAYKDERSAVRSFASREKIEQNEQNALDSMLRTLYTPVPQGEPELAGELLGQSDT